jgi:Response regulator containing CheY-like receiver, AAA-type ATPase, and DNA-binding domains
MAIRKRALMNKTVLVAEDHEDIRKMMKILLELYGYDVLEAQDGSEAVENAKEFHPDLILMDLAMPIMDGIAATKAIRKVRGFAHVPILAVTGYGKDYAQKALDSGCDEVLQKPINFSRLRPLLSQYLA